MPAFVQGKFVHVYDRKEDLTREDFRLHTLSLSYFSFIDMQMSGIYVTYEWRLIKECKVQLNIMK
jgi:hypothetical protein